jgi:hypothetical protein
MPTNLAIDDRLLEEAQRVGRHRTKRETVTLHYGSKLNITNNRKSSPCSGGLLADAAITISESARQSVYECVDRLGLRSAERRRRRPGNCFAFG